VDRWLFNNLASVGLLGWRARPGGELGSPQEEEISSKVSSNSSERYKKMR